MLAAILFSLSFIALVFFNAYLSILFGDEVKLRARGYDPRDILSGNFVRLDYGIRVKEGELPQNQQIKEFFVMLVDENADGVFEFGAKSFDAPKDGIYIKAKRPYVWTYECQIGAEKYFAPKEKALETELKLRNLPSSAKDESGKFYALVTLKIYKGKARIVNFEIIDDTKDDNLQGKADDEN